MTGCQFFQVSLKFERVQNGSDELGRPWKYPEDATHLDQLRAQAAALRKAQAPTDVEVREAHLSVSNVDPVNMEAALEGRTVASPLPQSMRKIIASTS